MGEAIFFGEFLKLCACKLWTIVRDDNIGNAMCCEYGFQSSDDCAASEMVEDSNFWSSRMIVNHK